MKKMLLFQMTILCLLLNAAGSGFTAERRLLRGSEPNVQGSPLSFLPHPLPAPAHGSDDASLGSPPQVSSVWLVNATDNGGLVHGEWCRVAWKVGDNENGTADDFVALEARMSALINHSPL